MKHFNNTFLTISGVQLHDLAAKKLTLLQTYQQRLREELSRIRTNLGWENELVDMIETKVNKDLRILDRSISFCQTLMDFHDAGKTYETSVEMANFLNNQSVIDYDY